MSQIVRRPRSGRRPATRQSTTVPSATDTPIWGIVTSIRVLSTRGAHGTPPSRDRPAAAPPARAAARTGSERPAWPRARPGRRATRSHARRSPPRPRRRRRTSVGLVDDHDLRASLRPIRRIASTSSGTSERRSSTSTDASSTASGAVASSATCDHRAVGDHDEVGPRAGDPRRERRLVDAVRHLALDAAVQVLVLHEADRVRIANRRVQQPLGVRDAVDGATTLIPGECMNQRLGVLRVERAAGETAAGGQPHDDRARRGPGGSASCRRR